MRCGKADIQLILKINKWKQKPKVERKKKGRSGVMCASD